MLKNCVIFLIFVAGVIFAEINVSPTVTTEYGMIEGVNYETPSGFETELFLGIPFAKSPINDLRFEKPLPPDPWTIPLQAKSLKPQCATYPDMLAPNGIEDCLTLNIIRPSAPSENSDGYSVMVWIHGGAFVIGSASDYNCSETAERMVSKGIIFVSINYRLGPFGFFSTGDSDAPGNYGLWDQIQALKFIQQIIGAFGGNPKSVTIFGESAGGGSVSWLTLTPETKDLFARAIPMSGSALAPWAHTDDVISTSKQLVETLGCAKSKNIKKCLKSKSMEEIKEATAKFARFVLKSDGVNLAAWHPRIDGEFLHGLTVEQAIAKAPKKDHFMGICGLEHVIFGKKGDFTWKANCEGLYNSENSSQLVLCLTFELQTPNSVPAANNSTDNSPINKPVTSENNVKISLLYEIMSDKTYADVVLFSSTGKEILTYRCILAKFSKFFKTIFDETKELPVQHKIKEFDTETIIAALNFCYGKNDVIKNNEKKLFEFAEKYCIEELKESCCAHFADNLSTENVCDIIQIAYSNNFEELKQKCKNLMTEKKAEIDQTKLKALPKDILFDVYF